MGLHAGCFDFKKEIRVEADPDFVAAALVAAGICADDTCGEAQHYREDRPTRPSAGQLQAGHGAGALQVVRESLFLSGPLSAALGTATNSPGEYGPHWAGFGKRYGMRLTGVSTGNAMEASLGANLGGRPALLSLAKLGLRGAGEVRDQ